MRTRRQFRPTIDNLTLRLAPSGGVCPNPVDESASILPRRSIPWIRRGPRRIHPDSGLPYAGPPTQAP